MASRARRLVAPLLGYVGITAALFLPLLRQLGSGLHDRSDSALNTWIVSWQAFILPRNPLALFDAPIFYPLRDTLAFSEILWPAAPMATPLLAATGNPVLVYNLLFLGSFCLAGCGAYLLALQVTGNRPAAFVAGLIYAYSPHQFGHLSQLQLLSIGWLPLVLLYLERFWRGGRPRDGALLSLAIAAQTLSAFYYGFQVVLVVGVYVLCRLVAVLFGDHGKRRGADLIGFPRRVDGGRGAQVSRALSMGQSSKTSQVSGEAFSHLSAVRELSRLAHLLPWGVLAVVLVAPFAAPYLRVRASLGLERSLAEALGAAPGLADYLLPRADHPLYGPLLAGRSWGDGGLFLGLFPLGLAVLGLVTWRTRGRRGIGRVFLVLSGLIALVLSLGPRLKFDSADAGGMSLPFGWLYTHVPGMTVIRAPGRFGVTVFLVLALLAAAGLAWLLRRLPSDPARAALAGLVSMVCLAEYAAGLGPFVVQPMPPLNPPPPVYAWLAEQPPTAAILELPLASEMAVRPFFGAGPDAESAWPDYNLMRYLYFGTVHWLPSIDGYSGFVPPHHRELGLTLADFPSARSLVLLRGLDVKWVVIHSQLMGAFRPGKAERLRAELADTPAISHYRDFGPDWVYRVNPAFSLPVTGMFWATETGETFLILSADGAGTAVLPPDQPLTVRGEWQPAAGGAAHTTESAVRLPLLVGEKSVVPLVLDGPERPGEYVLQLEAHDIGLRVPPYTATVTLDAGNDPSRLLPLQVLPQPGAWRATPGERFTLNLGWRLTDRPDGDYSIAARILDPNGQVVAQEDRPLSGGQELVLNWSPGMVVTTTLHLTLPADALGRYSVLVTVYRLNDRTDYLFLDQHGAPAAAVRGSLIVKPADFPTTSLPPAASLAEYGGQIYLLAVSPQPPRAAGEPFRLGLTWAASRKPDADYTVFVHLVTPSGDLLAQRDSGPRAGRYPTGVWAAGELVEDSVEIKLPPEASGQIACMRLGLYDAATAVRLARDDAPRDLWEADECWQVP